MDVEGDNRMKIIVINGEKKTKKEFKIEGCSDCPFCYSFEGCNYCQLFNSIQLDDFKQCDQCNKELGELE